MTNPNEHPSDRELLLHEIKSLGTEIARLRGDTRDLVRTEMRRARWRSLALGALAFLLLALPLSLFYVSEQRDDAEKAKFQAEVRAFEQATVEACQIRNRALENDVRFAQALVAAFERRGGGSDEFLDIVKVYANGLGETVDCSKRERLLEK